jgi:PadR family transcriptional regulator, regulatory protein AphA
MAHSSCRAVSQAAYFCGVARASDPESLNQTARIVLGMIAEGHTTGYAIKAEIERSTRLYWGASVGGIYPELRRLAESGLVSVRDDPRGDSVRHCYELTPAGRDSLRRWLTDTAEPSLELRDEALLQLRFAGVLEPAEQIEVVRRMRALHRRRAADLEALIEADEFDDPFHRMTIEFGLSWNRWACEWCSTAERRLARQKQARRVALS